MYEKPNDRLHKALKIIKQHASPKKPISNYGLYELLHVKYPPYGGKNLIRIMDDYSLINAIQHEDRSPLTATGLSSKGENLLKMLDNNHVVDPETLKIDPKQSKEFKTLDPTMQLPLVKSTPANFLRLLKAENGWQYRAVMVELAEMNIADSTKHINRLVDMGLVEYDAPKERGRAQKVRLTPLGIEYVNKRLGSSSTIEQRFLGNLLKITASIKKSVATGKPIPYSVRQLIRRLNHQVNPKYIGITPHVEDNIASLSKHIKNFEEIQKSLQNHSAKTPNIPEPIIN